MAKEKQTKNVNKGGLFIPAGLLIGLGIGFLVDNIPAWLLIGLGAGFVMLALAEFTPKK